MICFHGICFGCEWWQLFMVVPVLITVFWNWICNLIGLSPVGTDGKKCSASTGCTVKTSDKKGDQSYMNDATIPMAKVYSPNNKAELEDDLRDLAGRGFKAVLIDLYADWCEPCKKISPKVERLPLDENMPVLKLDIEKDYGNDKLLEVQALPTFRMMLIEETEDNKHELIISDKFQDVIGTHLPQVIQQIHRYQELMEGSEDQ